MAIALLGCFDDNFDAIIDDENNFEGFAPQPGNDGLITIVSVTSSNVKLSWKKATDNITPQENLQYLVYYSKNNPITSVKDAEFEQIRE